MTQRNQFIQYRRLSPMDFYIQMSLEYLLPNAPCGETISRNKTIKCFEEPSNMSWLVATMRENDPRSHKERMTKGQLFYRKVLESRFHPKGTNPSGYIFPIVLSLQDSSCVCSVPVTSMHRSLIHTRHAPRNQIIHSYILYKYILCISLESTFYFAFLCFYILGMGPMP